ncbi:MAG: rhamnulokinase, partial [Clostridia bacterium]|nr:rhamnulokinase [Clostridia bacterium]
SGKKFAQINMLGGGIKDTLLCRLTAAATDVKVVAGPTEATVMGNIAVQLIALGEIKNLAEARKIITASTPLKVYEPDDAAAWETAFAEDCKYLGKSGKKV